MRKKTPKDNIKKERFQSLKREKFEKKRHGKKKILKKGDIEDW